VCPTEALADSSIAPALEGEPDLFAQAMALEAPVVCGERIVEGVETAAGSGGECEKDGDTTPLIANAKWVPYVMTYGALDELVPFAGGLEQVEAFEKLGYRYYAVLYPAEDHLVFATQNDFARPPRSSGSSNASRIPLRSRSAGIPSSTPARSASGRRATTGSVRCAPAAPRPASSRR
jgi:hypothetical protein